VRTGEDFLGVNQTSFMTFINLKDVDVPENNLDCSGKIDDPVDCTDPDVFHLLMRAAINWYRVILEGSGHWVKNRE